MSNRERIGSELADLRNKRGMTTRQLAELCGVNNANITKIERGNYNVSIDILSKICDKLGAKVSIIAE